MSEYLGQDELSAAHLHVALKSRFPRLRNISGLLGKYTGITGYYHPFRTETMDFIQKHARRIGVAFEMVSRSDIEPTKNVRQITEMLLSLGPIRRADKKISPLNALTPVLACLDPKRRFPIMNKKTERLLRIINEGQDAKGAVALCDLIEQGVINVSNSLELDVYSQTADFSGVAARRHSRPNPRLRDLGIKSEIDSCVQIARSSRKIRKVHNELTNRAWRYLRWRYKLEQSDFDVLVRNWRDGRDLLIEAKSAVAGSAGRTQIRLAIGQLFDYRFCHFPKQHLDLAVLLPSEPPYDIKALMQSLKIECIWFKGKKLDGSITL